MTRIRSHVLLWSILGMLLVPIGCSGLKSLPYRPEIPTPAKEALEEALLSYYDADRQEAASRLEKLVGEYPTFVEAHRYLQNLYMAENRYGYLVNRYRELMENHPENPSYAYLLGRVLSSSENRVDLFSRSVNLDKTFFWGFNGLGYARMSTADFDASEAAFDNAIHSAPDRVEPYLGLITLYLAYRKYDQAAGLLTKALKYFPSNLPLLLLKYRHIEEKEGPLAALITQVDIPPEIELNHEFFSTVQRTLEKSSTDALLQRILYRFAPLADEPDMYHGTLDTLLGICCRKLGDLNGALRYFSRVHAGVGSDIRVRRELRFLYTVYGRIEEAYAVQIADCPQEWLEGSRYNEYKERLFALAERIKPGTAGVNAGKEICEFAELLMGLGWLEEAAYHLSSIADQHTESARRASDLLEEIYRHLNFELALREFFLHEYRRYSRDGSRSSLEETVERLATMSREILGHNIFDPTKIKYMDFSPVGALMDPRPSSKNEPAEYFRKYNRFFLIGQKMGGPVEAYLLDLFDYEPSLMETIGGVEIEFDLARCENLRIPSLIEFQGGNIAGAGLHSIVFINLDSIRQEVQAAHATYQQFWELEDILLDDPPPRAEDEQAARDISEPLGLSARLKYISFKETGAGNGIAAYMGKRFNVIYCHELQHLVDVRKFMPISHHLLWSLYQFAIRGFSSFNVEAWLEGRSQLLALLIAEDSHAVLAEVADHIRGDAVRGSPHRKGYTSLIQRFVDHVSMHPDQFPEIDRNADILHQLHRLSRRQIRKVARMLAIEDGIVQDY